MWNLFAHKKPIIGMIYLAANPGRTKHPGLADQINMALEDCQTLVNCGIDGVLVENENDRPYTITASQTDIDAMSEVCKELKNNFSTLPIGVEFLINDPKASLTIAKKSGLDFIRTDYFVDRMSRPELGGEMEINPKDVNEFRNINCPNIHILADIQVKHAELLEEGKPISLSCQQAKSHGASGAIISGELTGVPPSTADLSSANTISGIKKIIGSGLSVETISEIFPYMDAAIVGTALLTNGRCDKEKTIRFMNKVRELRSTL